MISAASKGIRQINDLMLKEINKMYPFNFSNPMTENAWRSMEGLVCQQWAGSGTLLKQIQLMPFSECRGS